MASRIAALSTAFAAVANAQGGWGGSGGWGGPGGNGGNGGQSSVTINVNPSTKYQSFDGIGVSEAFQRGLVIHELNPAAQAEVLDYLFSNKTGAGMTILRNGLGSAPTDPFDLMKSIAPVAPASNSSQLAFIPLPREDEYQVWLSHQAIARGVTTVYADAWSADGYMKTNGTEDYGGYLCGVTNATCASGDWRQSYANKIVKYIQDYAAEGITINYVGFLNEPDLNTTYASMQSNGQQAADFIEILYPTLKAAGLNTQIACCDGSGWEQNRERLTGIQEAGYENDLGLVTSHGYSSYPGAPFVTSKKVWQTEWSTFDNFNKNWYTTGGSQSDGIAWANRIQKLFTISNVTGHLYWWGAANTTDNQSLLFVNNTAEVTVTGRLWAHVHYGSRFIRAGAHRIDAVSGSAALNVSAFANTDGSTAVQVINNSNNTETITLSGVPMQWGWGHSGVKTYLTNNANNLTEGVARSLPGGKAIATIPGQSLLSLVVS
ncbi:hypothetical protein LTR78_005156 [Recurvomyces mirabilis]|uniref:Uncharacterized protein n=1 Tax=Recurvomyces mirabilis TaxID=574656 RepID=A0AAE0WN61_9PEZI|nr:hypothetical protein LTR78_005156 [Recurvomyces mirabilis]KAK5157706.1 hypothetical protein LTS14_003628 [Recurvomyces mirabilis]